MNIGDISNSGYSSAKHVKSHGPSPVNEVDARIAATTESTEDDPNNQDTVAISEEARIAHAAEQKRRTDLEFAREKLKTHEEMTPDRQQELLERLNSGYYTQPEVIENIAGKIADELLP